MKSKAKLTAALPQTPGRLWPEDGAFAFPCEPGIPASIRPAIWDPLFCAFDVILDAAPFGNGNLAPIDVTSWPVILADVQLSDGRHLVLGDTDGPHHLWLRDSHADHPLAYIILKDGATELRLASARRFDRRLAGAPPMRRVKGYHPSPFLRHRLSLMLDILDMQQSANGNSPSSHTIARKLIYPRMAIAPGAEWKSSSERRRTQRLIREAAYLMNGGYRDLLAGRIGGRQK